MIFFAFKLVKTHAEQAGLARMALLVLTTMATIPANADLVSKGRTVSKVILRRFCY